MCVCVAFKQGNGWEREPCWTFPLGDIYYGLLIFIKCRTFYVLTKYIGSYGEGLKRRRAGIDFQVAMMTTEIMPAILGSHDWAKKAQHLSFTGLLWRAFHGSGDKKNPISIQA